jgi:penicillin-binding protein A
MQFTREMRWLLIGLLAAFLGIALATAYWAVYGPDTLLLREDNPRLFQAQASIIRGDIVDRNGELLVTSVRNPGGRVSRDFIYPAMNSILGYYSLRYGVGGAEAAFDNILRGGDLPVEFETYFSENILHHAHEGSDIQLTLDLTIQQKVFESLKGQKGAAVVLSVPDGGVLALISLPTFNPDTLDADWNTLIAAPEQPFFNRALQGRYQPGSVLQTPLITAALIAGINIDVLAEGASQPIQIDGLTLRCVLPPPADRLALSEAYAFACPAPFMGVYNELGAAQIQETFSLFRLGQPSTLPGFVDILPSPTLENDPVPLTLENTLGQGDLTLSPLDVAVMTAAIVNEGNAPQPNILMATRLPGAVQWQPVNTLYPTAPVTTAETSRRLQQLMRSATISGAATRAARAGMNIGGHAAVAYSGEQVYVWFTGFVVTGARQGVVVALVLENPDYAAEAAAIGGQILEAAFNRSTLAAASGE